MHQHHGTLNYRGYAAIVGLDRAGRQLRGEVIGADLEFFGASLAELRAAFEHEVNTYLQLCADRGVKPLRDVSGRLTLRLGLQLHRRLEREAAVRGQQLTEYIRYRLSQAPNY